MGDVTPETRLTPEEHIAFREIAGGAIVVNLLTGACFRLNHVGADLWKHFAMGQTIRFAAASIRSRYDVPSEAVEADALDLCKDLLANGLLSKSTHEGPR